MNSEKLSKRLEAVAKYIPTGARLADIGSDHAYLPCYAIKNAQAASAIAGEVVDGPYQSALKQVQLEGLTDKIEVRKGDGLEVISVGEIDCITIAGMGGSLIASILERGRDKLKLVKRLILQPNIGAISIRTWLIEHGWELINEEILEEDGKIYEILVAEQGDPLKPYKKESLQASLLLGPFLKLEKTDAFMKKWQNELQNWQRILAHLEFAAQTTENAQKKKELQLKVKIVEEVFER